MYDKLREYTIVLGSGSPRRKYLLEQMGLSFSVKVNKSLKETWPDGLSKLEIPVYLAELKAVHIMDTVPENTLLITADTIVWMEGRVINKPADRKDAFNMLKQLSGNMHEVLTGVCFRISGKKHSFHASSLVWFASLTDTEINYYIDHYKPFDKAGAYGIQDWIGYIGVEKIEGSYFNVMGLPLQRMYHELKSFIGDE
ncbi:MAG: septum formation protein Maf [Bacteroidales bacterium]|nr:septum formation protein Maf [Bacteroidales bacterium]